MCHLTKSLMRLCMGHRGQCVPVQMLFMVGPYLQAELGWRMFLGLYFVAGVAANVAEYIGNVLIRYGSICPCYLTGPLEKGIRSPSQLLKPAPAVFRCLGGVMQTNLQPASCSCGGEEQPAWSRAITEHNAEALYSNVCVTFSVLCFLQLAPPKHQGT